MFVSGMVVWCVRACVRACWPVVGTIVSVASLHSLESRLVFPEPVSPIHTTSYSALGGGGPLQHRALKHWERKRWGGRKNKKEINGKTGGIKIRVCVCVRERLCVRLKEKRKKETAWHAGISALTIGAIKQVWYQTHTPYLIPYPWYPMLDTPNPHLYQSIPSKNPNPSQDVLVSHLLTQYCEKKKIHSTAHFHQTRLFETCD